MPDYVVHCGHLRVRVTYARVTFPSAETFLPRRPSHQAPGRIWPKFLKFWPYSTKISGAAPCNAFMLRISCSSSVAGRSGRPIYRNRPELLIFLRNFKPNSKGKWHKIFVFDMKLTAISRLQEQVATLPCTEATNNSRGLARGCL